MKTTIEGTVADELLNRIEQRLSDLELKVTSFILERDEYVAAIGQIEALRWCKEEVKDLSDKLL